MNSRKRHLIDVMARAMAKRSGTHVDEMRPSTWRLWKDRAEAALDALSEEIGEMRA